MTITLAPRLETFQLKELNEQFEAKEALEVIGWAVDTFAPHLCLTASMTDAVLIDLATRVYPTIEVIFIDTGCHFPETLETLKRVRQNYGLSLKIMTVRPYNHKLWITDPENCCSDLKVEQLERALDGKLAWMSGLRRADSKQRAGTPIVMRDARGLVKINPIATWSDEQVANYIVENDVPYNPLLDQGYPSIGCQTCTQPVADNNSDKRSGRWVGQKKTECGLHI